MCQVYRSKGERRQIASYYTADFTIDIGDRARPAQARAPRRDAAQLIDRRDVRCELGRGTDSWRKPSIDWWSWVWTVPPGRVLDPMRQRGLMPNLDALLAGAASGTLPLDRSPGHDGRLDDHDDRLRPAPAWRLRPPLLRRGRRPDEGQPLGPDPRPDALAPACRCRPDRSSASTCPACILRSRSRASSSRAWTPRISRRPCRPARSSPPAARPRCPATAWAISGSTPPSRSKS